MTPGFHTVCFHAPVQEMTDIVKAIYDMMGKYTYPVLKEDTPRQHVDVFFQVGVHPVFELDTRLRSVNPLASEQWFMSNPRLCIVGHRKELQTHCSPGIDHPITLQKKTGKYRFSTDSKSEFLSSTKTPGDQSPQRRRH